MAPSWPLAILSLLFCSVHAWATEYLNMTTTAAVGGTSVIQCWRLNSPFVQTSGTGTGTFLSAQLGNLANASYSIFTAGTDYGVHVAPNVQYVVLLYGTINITAPGTRAATIVTGGQNGFLFAADTAATSRTGHETVFETESLLLQIPTEGGVIPPHTVLHDGPCVSSELPP